MGHSAIQVVVMRAAAAAAALAWCSAHAARCTLVVAAARAARALTHQARLAALPHGTTMLKFASFSMLSAVSCSAYCRAGLKNDGCLVSHSVGVEVDLS